ncbi:MAG: PD40 domain-containing protein [Anaerolineae bacterium]|nr:PD40 domain-containing protein [Anaerolineae bacterium]MBL8104193.1 PD40 domain-containing protein [Anaerolineales bacterium]MCC7188986.1 PD40 domain-containing protein [Anaerolineales bacterium]
MTLERGALLHKRYRIVEILGQGGMGSVYRAVDENLGVDVAVKENLFTTDEYARQFRLEAVILANLRHPNLPRVTDHFVIGDQGQYLVMDYIEGEDLRQRMERMGNITEDEAVLLGAAMCDALQYLHTRKPPILHRDLKPGNVKITPDGHVFLVDFGLAKVLHGSQATTTGARAMTPGYSPPEQYGTARTDPRTDIYSLGATLYAALSGIIPEDGLARAMDNTQLTPLRKRNSKVSRRLASAIERAMGIDPAERFQNAEEFKNSLLGSKGKTQRLPGDYVIQPAPAEDRSEPYEMGAIERASTPPDMSPSGGLLSPEEEGPIFKPPKRKKKGFIRRFVTAVLWLLLISAAVIVGAARFAPQFIPPALLDTLESLHLPFLFPSAVQTNIPAPTATPTATEPAVEATATVQSTFTHTPTKLPTATLNPTSTPTVDPSSLGEPTQIGGTIGQVAFASARLGIPQIFIINTDGSDPVQLTNLELGACQPSWSPDGARLAFISPCRARGEVHENIYSDAGIYLINADGSGLAPLTETLGANFDPAWSPDGTRIAFTSNRDGRNEIYTLEIASGQVTRLTTSDGSIESAQPSWSRDGRMIVYTVKRFDAYQVWAMSANGEDKAQLVRSGQQLWDYLPFWSLDGSTVFFNQRNLAPTRPWLMSIPFAGHDTLTPTKLALPTPIEDVEFSPDGLWIIFESSSGDGNRDIYYSTVSGGDRMRLTDDPEVDFDPTWRPVTGQ